MAASTTEAMSAWASKARRNTEPAPHSFCRRPNALAGNQLNSTSTVRLATTRWSRPARNAGKLSRMGEASGVGESTVHDSSRRKAMRPRPKSCGNSTGCGALEQRCSDSRSQNCNMATSRSTSSEPTLHSPSRRRSRSCSAQRNCRLWSTRRVALRTLPSQIGRATGNAWRRQGPPVR